jgi:CHRD domain/56kDa selenium binding protein (SBP56)
MLALGLVALAPAAVAGDNFVATLSGDQEVPTRDTQARGVATSKLRQDGAALAFKVNVANIDNVFAAHIHCGAVGVNGPVGVTLFMGAPAGGRVNGTLAAGTITAPDAGNPLRLGRPGRSAGLTPDPRLFPNGDDFRGLRVHQTRLQGGDASSDSYCYTS